PVTSACWVSPNSAETFEGGQLVASASFDHTVHFTRLSAPTNPEWSTLATLHLHTAPVSSVTASSSGHHLISAGWDGLLGVWTTNVPDRDEIQDAEEMMPKKRRKVEKGSAGALKKAPAVVLRSHMARVSKAIFDPLMGSNKAYSCGWDSTTLPDRAHLDVVASEAGETLFTASADRTVSLTDLRATSTQSSTKTLIHPSTPSCLATHPTSAHHLLTGAYDGALRVWDIRSPRMPLAKFEHVVQGQDDKVRRGKILGVDWAHGLAACAGEVGFGLWQAGVSGEEPR
ncbi:ribosome biogenesis protein ytm1, partial [Ceratobasidium sp. 395]